MNKITLSLLFVSSILFGDYKIYESSSQKQISSDELQSIISNNRYILMGEHHRNSEHHKIKGEIISSFNPSDTDVIMEHLEAFKRVAWSDGELLGDIESAGFNATGWKWPIHTPLFEQLRAKNISVIGGNISREKAREVAINGIDILDKDIIDIIKSTPFSPDEHNKISIDIIEGHCNMLPENMIEPMIIAQHAKDASMSKALLNSDKKIRFLIAGNNHVRKDYAIARILKNIGADNIITIGFVEDRELENTQISSFADRYQYIVVTSNSPLEDSCKNLKIKSYKE